MRRHIPRLFGSIPPLRRVALSNSAVLSLRPLSSTPFHSQTQPTASTSKLPIFSPPPGSSGALNPKPFYVTTPIFYVNASPHIGHLHSLILTDVLARFARLRWPERKVLFATGTDEHGLKIQQAARKLGIEEGEFCKGVSQRFRDLAVKANISNTDFIRTTEERHYKSVEHFWNKLVSSGDIYKGTHSGWYAISDECFYSSSQVKEVDGKMIAIETGNEVVWEEEENWKFRLPNYRRKLKGWIGRVDSVHPQSHRHEILRQIPTVEDLSISRPRSRVQWGIPVPGDETQTIYVWVEALVNYLTVLGYPDSLEGWPADVQVVGKDIIRFHALHWPALLFAAGLEPPQRVLTHAHWTMNRSKMSKSKGNVADPIKAMKVYGVDGVRWYLMRTGGSLGDDADYSEKELGVYYNQLRYQIGNLLSRIQSPTLIPKIGEFRPDLSPEEDGPIHNALGGLRDVVEGCMEGYEVSKACERIMEVVMLMNQRFTTLKPWTQHDATTPLTYAYTTLKITAILLQPIMPSKASDLLDRLGVSLDKRGWEEAVMPDVGDVDVNDIIRGLKSGVGGGMLFPKIDKDKIG